MCIYCGTNKYRRIYENHFGPIPKEENGRSYEIHHIDGNHSNNDPLNLKCVTIQEHYDVHYSQGDWGACLIMSDRMRLSSEEKSVLASKSQKLLVEQGTHHFLFRTSEDFTPEWKANISAAKRGKPTWNKGILRTEEEKNKMKEGRARRQAVDPTAYKQPPCSPEKARKIKEANTGKKWVHDGKGTRLNVGPNEFEKLVNDGWIPGLGKRTVTLVKCGNCGKKTDKANYIKWHGDKCKLASNNFFKPILTSFPFQ